MEAGEDKAIKVFGERLKIVREPDMIKAYSHYLFEKYKDDTRQDE